MGADLCSYHRKSFSYLVYSFVYFTSYVVASGDKMEIDLQMKVYSIRDDRFRKYGFVLCGYDFTELFENLGKVDMPDDGITYVASEPTLERCAVAKEMEIRGFGAMPVQLGYVSGRARQMAPTNAGGFNP